MKTTGEKMKEMNNEQEIRRKASWLVIELKKPSQVKSSVAKSSQVKSSQVKSSQVKSGQVKSSQVSHLSRESCDWSVGNDDGGIISCELVIARRTPR